MGKPRQAVVIIHGIGEQRPMDTLRGFVSGILAAADGATRKTFNKPDFNADGFELRRYRSFAGQEDSDFLEFYWQHLMPIARWRFLVSWLWRLMLRPPAAMPPRFAFLWWLCWGALVAFAVITISSIAAAWLGASDTFPSSAKLSGGAAIVAAAAGGVVLAFVGDAAIYLNPHPRTVEARNAIRAAGLALVERLQADPRYDRVVIVGHSLGSVIGYDVVNFAWQRASDTFRRAVDAGQISAPPTQQVELIAAEALAAKLRHEVKDGWPQAVRRIFQESRALGLEWKISDLVTIGSPLAHASLLLARGPDDLTSRFDERELPTAPPARETPSRFSYPRKLSTGEVILVPDHAAVFALVCWTNIYFPSRALLWGDAIGGPVATSFGPGVQDRAVRTSVRFGWLTHTAYWTTYNSFQTDEKSALMVLADVLDLDRGSFFSKPKIATLMPAKATEN